MTTDHIQKVVVQRFRCLPDQEVGPFGDFNLVVGRNGAGKTSFFEAIELALTGASQRIGPREDVDQIVSRGGNAVTTVYSDDGNALGTFAEGTLEGGARAQIQNLFGLDVGGQKARHLLPQLFGIHNVLYADTIVSFLHADQKRELNNALTELAAGAEAVKAWNKLSAAATHARSFAQEATASFGRRKQELNRLQEIVDELASMDDTHLVEHGRQLTGRIPPDFWDDKRPPPVEQLPEFLAQVSRIMPRLSGALGDLKDLSENMALAAMKTWEDISETRAAAEAAVERARSSRDGLRKKLVENTEKVSESKKAREITRKKVSALNETRDKYESLVNNLGALREWSAELDAHRQSRRLKEKSSALKATYLNWSRIDNEIRKLPIAESLIAKSDSRSRLKARLCELRKELKQALACQHENQEKLDETEELIRTSNENWSDAQDAINDFHKQLNRVLELQSGSQCPACGHEWDSEKNMVAAIASHFESLSELVGRPSRPLSKTISARDALQKKVRSASQDVESKSMGLEKVEERLAGVEEELSTTVEQLNRVIENAKREDRSIDLPLVDLESIGDRYLEVPFEDFRAKHRAAKAELENVDSRLISLRDGLRRQEFNLHAEELEAHIASASAALTELDLSLPADFAGGKMSELTARFSKELNKTTAEIAETEKDRRELAAELASLEEIDKDMRADVETADAVVKNRVEESLRASRIADLAEKLASLGLIPRRGTLQLARARALVAEAFDNASYLVDEGPQFIKKLKEESQVRKELDRAKTAMEREERQVRAARGLVKRFEGLASPASFEVQVISPMAGTVSEIFRRLHWPFDFKAVVFEEVDGRLEVFVEPRFADRGHVPAHQRLSAGQRAALAISVFWTLNSSRRIVPQVMLMDEPVQNIDELNALNFLDSLRWLVERGGRQIFLSTSSRRLAALVRKKFAYLGSRFAEVELSRSAEIAEIVVRRDTPRAVREPLASATR